MKRSRLKKIAIGAVIGVLLLTAIALAAGESLPRHVTAGGGDTVSAGNITLRNSIAQPVAGTVGNGITLCSGFVCGQSVATVAPTPTPTTASTPSPTATPPTPTATPDSNHFIYLPLVLK